MGYKKINEGRKKKKKKKKIYIYIYRKSFSTSLFVLFHLNYIAKTHYFKINVSILLEELIQLNKNKNK